MADPSLMGGSADLVEDIKNAYESLIRVLQEGENAALQMIALSLVPVRFPSLVPYTTSIQLDGDKEKINKFNDVSRLHRNPRSFEGRFQTDGRLITKEGNATFLFEDTFSSYREKYPFSESLKVIRKMDARTEYFLTQMSANNKGYNNYLLIDLTVLMALFVTSVYLYFLNRCVKSTI